MIALKLFSCASSLGLASCIKCLSFKECEHLTAQVYSKDGQHVLVLLALSCLFRSQIFRV